MGHELKGELKIKGAIEEVSDKFRKKVFVIETDDKYPQQVQFELIQDDVYALDNFNIGDELKVSFNVRGREWKGKYFTNLQAYKVEGLATSRVVTKSEPKPKEEAKSFIPDNKETTDDLPF